MKPTQSKQFYSNKSGLLEKKPSNLVIQTNLENAFDNRWAEVKIQGKNISRRSNHVAVIFENSLFVHGGYDVEKGILGDFHSMDLSENCKQFTWKTHNNSCGGKEIKLKSHSGVVYKQKLIFFGGEKATGINSNLIYIYDFGTSIWKQVEPSIDVPKVDSHCVVVVQDKMLVYGGYVSDQADYLRNCYSFNLTNLTWDLLYKTGKGSGPEPVGRSNFSMVEHQGGLLIFGGTDGSQTLNDLWIFDIKNNSWKQLETRDTPDPRRGHSMISFDNYFFMFGGIQDVTKEKNDICILNTNKNQWHRIHTTTNSVYDCSPTLKNSKKKSPERSPKRMSPEKSERGDIAMKKILIENKQKKFMERKKELLKQFVEQEHEGKPRKRRELSPTTESMLKTLQAIGNQQSPHKQLRQQILYDDSHRFIIGKKPCARDGQSVTVLNEKMCIFGGDRHLMAFNDFYQFDLAKGVKSLLLYKPS